MKTCWSGGAASAGSVTPFSVPAVPPPLLVAAGGAPDTGVGVAALSVPQADSARMDQGLAQVELGLQDPVKRQAPHGAAGSGAVALYVEGDQDPAADFAALTEQGRHAAVVSLSATRGLEGAPAAAVAIRE